MDSLRINYRLKKKKKVGTEYSWPTWVSRPNVVARDVTTAHFICKKLMGQVVLSLLLRSLWQDTLKTFSITFQLRKKSWGERWRVVSTHVALQGTRVQFPAPTQQGTTICNSNPRIFDALTSKGTRHTRGTHAYHAYMKAKQSYK